MATKHLRLFPKTEKITYDGYLLSKSIIARFREMIETDEIKFNNAGKKHAKQELIALVRKETHNTMCAAEMSEVVSNAVNEYVDNFFQSVFDRDMEYGAHLMSVLIQRIEDDVWHVNRIAQ